ncbi:SDR family oxidoreductase [Cyclobacterium sp.]|uniref:SDR family oxidoreductase n=1 Tax=Cyclobacterium sp. TaxID=1966343 RepID=UPI00199E6EC4|nr:SDR family oxidoreductase [Cyclobacterium sp.]MBD3627749.1 SDR family oxidoreductase [Cyclobacterium sp.]
MKNQITSKTVVITGASAGLGRACAREFASQGHNVAVIARNTSALESVKREIESYGNKGMYVQADVADAKALAQAIDKIELELGEIDILVNNAMVSVFSPVSKMQPEEYLRVTEVTYLGQVYGTLAVLKKMKARNEGSIVFVGSALAYRGIPLQSAYCASKHAIKGFYESLRAELMHEKSNIKISMVELPAMNTTQFGFVKSRLPNKPKPMGTIYQPEVAAKAMVHAAKHNRREYFVGFSTIKTIWGNRLAPWLVDWTLSRNGISGQQTDQRENKERNNNLWDPVPGDHGVHGGFGKKSKNFSLTFWFDKRRFMVLAGIFIILTLYIIIYEF